MDLMELEPSVVQSSLAGSLPRAIVSLLSEDDLDMQEKALTAVKQLAELDSSNRQTLTSHGVPEAIVALRRRLVAVMDSERAAGETDLQYHTYLQAFSLEVLQLLQPLDATYTKKQEL